MNALHPGDPAPDFTAEAHNGQQVRLADYRGKSVVVLYFYPMDGTPVCTKEACGFRDAFEEFSKLGAVVIGVSADSPGTPPDVRRQPGVALPAAERPGRLVAESLPGAEDAGHPAQPCDLRDRQAGLDPARLQRRGRARAACDRGV